MTTAHTTVNSVSLVAESCRTKRMIYILDLLITVFNKLV